MPIEPLPHMGVPLFENMIRTMELKLTSLSFAMLLAMCCAGQTQPAPQARSQQTVQDPVQGGWHLGGGTRTAVDGEAKEDQHVQMDQASHPSSMEAGFHQIRSDRNSALARNKGILTPQDRIHLAGLAGSIESQAPNSFEAHMARFYAEFPATPSFQYLDRAMMREPTRDELIGPKLADAARRHHKDDLISWSRAMKERGGVAPALWTFADDLLLSVSQNGVLIAAGEMDAYPLWTRQYAEGSRKDVLVADVRLLGDPAYRQRIWEITKARGPVPAAEKDFVLLLADAIDRPLFLSPALGSERIGFPPDKLYVVGLALQYGNSPLHNMLLLEKRWGQMKKTTEAGPLSRNYLLPGVVLLKHYREQQDETKSSLMEHELRQLAKKLNATQDLYRMGVFQH